MSNAPEFVPLRMPASDRRRRPRLGRALEQYWYRLFFGNYLIPGNTWSSVHRRQTRTNLAPKVAIIDEVLAKKLWPDGDALGQRIQYAAENAPVAKRGGGAHNGMSADLSEEEKQEETIEIVGIVPATRHSILLRKIRPAQSTCHSAHLDSKTTFPFLFGSVRSHPGNEAVTADLLRRAVRNCRSFDSQSFRCGHSPNILIRTWTSGLFRAGAGVVLHLWGTCAWSGRSWSLRSQSLFSRAAHA